MASTGTVYYADMVPWSPLSAPASIFPAVVAPAQDDVGTAGLLELGSLRPFGLDLEAPAPEPQA